MLSEYHFFLLFKEQLGYEDVHSVFMKAEKICAWIQMVSYKFTIYYSSHLDCYLGWQLSSVIFIASTGNFELYWDIVSEWMLWLFSLAFCILFSLISSWGVHRPFQSLHIFSLGTEMNPLTLGAVFAVGFYNIFQLTGVFIFIFNLYWSIVDLQCCIILDVQQVSQLYIYIYSFIFRFFSLIGHYRVLSRVSCTIK